ncbi:MAG: hypothetical protein ACK56I_17550 [bacterium]
MDDEGVPLGVAREVEHRGPRERERSVDVDRGVCARRRHVQTRVRPRPGGSQRRSTPPSTAGDRPADDGERRRPRERDRERVIFLGPRPVVPNAISHGDTVATSRDEPVRAR